MCLTERVVDGIIVSIIVVAVVDIDVVSVVINMIV